MFNKKIQLGILCQFSTKKTLQKSGYNNQMLINIFYFPKLGTTLFEYFKGTFATRKKTRKISLNILFHQSITNVILFCYCASLLFVCRLCGHVMPYLCNPFAMYFGFPPLGRLGIQSTLPGNHLQNFGAPPCLWALLKGKQPRKSHCRWY